MNTVPFKYIMFYVIVLIYCNVVFQNFSSSKKKGRPPGAKNKKTLALERGEFYVDPKKIHFPGSEVCKYINTVYFCSKSLKLDIHSCGSSFVMNVLPKQ